MKGYAPLGPAAGLETLHVAREQQPDVILLDVGLPGKSGLRVLEDLRKRSSTRDIPVMLLSGQINLVEKGHAHDAEAAFHKPLDFFSVPEQGPRDNRVRRVTLPRL